MSVVSHLVAFALLSCCPELIHRDPGYPAGDLCGEKMPASPQLFQPLQLSCQTSERGPLGSSSPSHPRICGCLRDPK